MKGGYPFFLPNMVMWSIKWTDSISTFSAFYCTQGRLSIITIFLGFIDYSKASSNCTNQIYLQYFGIQD